MNSFADNMKAILDTMAVGDYDSARRMVNALREQATAESFDLKELEPSWGIAVASLIMDEGDYVKAQSVIEDSICADCNNYELYYMLGLCCEQLGNVSDAYYVYKLAAYLGRGSADEQLIVQQHAQLCSYASTSSYEQGKACERLVVSRMKLGEYERTHVFLGELLYDTNPVAANVVLSEPNMLLHMMLEIVLCEMKYMDETSFKRYNTVVRYDCDVNKFNEVYKQVKLAVRRVWFGASIEEQYLVKNLVEKYSVSKDMLAVIIKYSVREEYWEDVFARIAAIIQYNNPAVGIEMLRYRKWIVGLDIAGKQRCMEPVEYDNGAKVLKLDASKDQEPQDEMAQESVQGDKDNEIAIVFCTNDALYEAECISYLKKLQVPEGMSLKIVSVWNATGMAAAYNSVINRVGSKYKFYIHHDTFIIKRDILSDFIREFKADETVGLIGIGGTRKLNDVAKWWESDKGDLRMCLYQDAVLNILRSVSIVKNGDMEEAQALDGILIATSKDVRWREDIFDGWHFYDISQCYEFNRAGYKTCVMNYDEPVVMHETTMKKDAQKLYDKYRELFIKEYL